MGSKKPFQIFEPGSNHWVGDGFPVRNFFPSNPILEKTDPFLLLDYAGPREFAPSNKAHGVGEHPHRGFETVTLLYQGEVEHRDSGGHAGKLQAGDVQWMTAASGVVHEEMHGRDFAKQGGTFEAIQLWVNLPKKLKMGPPRYQDISRKEIPIIHLADGVEMRIIAGNYQRTQGPAKTFTPINLWELQVSAEKEVELDIPSSHNCLIFVRFGKLVFGDDGDIGEAQLAVYTPNGKNIRFSTKQATKVVVMTGEPLGEPIVQRGPFVMNTQEEIIQAIQDYQSGKMGHLTSIHPYPSNRSD